MLSFFVLVFTHNFIIYVNFTERYTNDLHDALLSTQGVAFWKCWKAKFECSNRHVSHVNGITDPLTVAENFAFHFQKSCSSYSVGVFVHTANAILWDKVALSAYSESAS